MPNPTAAMLVIGDEILSGRTRDSNLYHLAQALTAYGIDLKEARIIADQEAAIIQAAQELSEKYDHLFTSGGIGPTHDDITAEAIAAAFATPIGVRQDARDLLADYYAKSATKLNDARLRMARIPEGARLIANPISAAPGFSLYNVHVMAGVPAIFEVMLADLLPRLVGGTPLLQHTLRLECGEGAIAERLTAIVQKYPDLSFGSYPFNQNGNMGTHILVRGTDPTLLEQAMAELSESFVK